MNFTQRSLALSLCLTLCLGAVCWLIFPSFIQTGQTRWPRKIEVPNLHYDQPEEAMEHYLRKRLPQGMRELSVERYVAAQLQMNAMPQYSTALGRALPSRGAMKGDPDQQSLGTWTSLGPGNIGGRARAFLIHPANPATMYAAGVAGGVWRTIDGGATWTPIADLIANIAVNSMVMEPGNPNVIYAGTGQGTFAGSAMRGAGIFKTTDAGATWTQLAGTNNIDFHYVNDIVISPSSNQRVYAATRTGVWLSTDGGVTWTKSLALSVQGGCMDLAIRTDQTADALLASAGTLTAATIYRNTDAAGGGSWTPVLTEAGMGRTSLAFAPSDQNIVYASAASIAGGPYQHGLHAVFRSTDGGATWTARVRNTDPNKLKTAILSYPAFLSGSQFGSLTCSPETSDFRAQAWLTNVIAVDPVNANRVWVGGIDLFRSDDGGANWGIASYWYANGVLKPRAAAYTHADQMVLAFHPQYNGTSNRTLYVTNDGGIYSTSDALAATSTAPCNPASAAVAWTSLNNNFGVTQFYHGTPYPNGATYFGGTQDNGTLRGTDADGADAWREIHFGDGGYVAVDPANTNTLFAENTGLSIHKSTDGGATFRPAISGITESRSDFLFITPFAMDPSDPKRLWTGGFFIWRTGNGAEQWERAAAITAGLGSVSAIAVAPTDSNYVLAGMSTGEVLRTTTGLSSGVNTIWPYASPRPNSFISSVAFDPVNKSTVYATSSTFGGAHVFKSINGGANWAVLDGTGAGRIPDIPVHSISIDPANTQRLYVGTDLGVFVSTNGGAAWAVENTGFANVVTESLALNVVDGQTHLYAFTFGRGAWRVNTNNTGCNFSLSTSGQTFPNTEASGTVNVIAAPGACAWTAMSNADWITVTSGASGTGNGAITFSIAPNTTSSLRSGTISVAGRSFNVTQQGCQFTLSQTSRVMEAAGGQGSVNVAVDGINCSWIASSNANWIAIQTTSGGVNYTVAANTGLFGRSGTITIAGQTFIVLQSGTGGTCAATPITLGQPLNGSLGQGDCLSPARGGNRFADRYSFGGTAGQQVAISQASQAIDAYLYMIGPNGAIVAEDDDGGDGTSARIPAESGFLTLPATGTYLIEATTLGENRSGDYTVSLTRPCSYALSAANQTFAAGGGTGSVSVTALGGCGWMATSDSSWLAVTSGASGNGNGMVNFSVAPNTSTTSSRTGKLTIADQTFTVSQAIREPNKTPQITSLTPNPVAMGGQGFTLTVDGRDFVAGSVVRWDGSDRATTLVNSARLTAAIPASDIAAARDVKITVFSPDGGGVSNQIVLTIASTLANVPAASFTGMTIAPDSIVAAFGIKLATATKVATATPLPTELEGTTVKITDSVGAERLAQLFFVSPTQINYLMPAEAVAGPAIVTVKSGDGSLSAGAVQIALALPALFTANASGQGIAAGVVLRVKADGAQVYEPIARFDPAESRFVAEPIDLSNPNEQAFLILYGSGIRYRTSLTAVTLTIGGASQPVLFAGAVEGLAGLDQLNIGPLTRSLIGRGDVDVALAVDGIPANTVRIGIK